MSTTNSPLVDNCLRLRAALAGLPAGRRQDIIEGVTQHIADARLQLEQDSQEGDEAVQAGQAALTQASPASGDSILISDVPHDWLSSQMAPSFVMRARAPRPPACAPGSRR